MLTLLCLAFIDEATSSPIKPPPIIRMFFEIFILDFNSSHSLIFRKYIISLSFLSSSISIFLFMAPLASNNLSYEYLILSSVSISFFSKSINCTFELVLISIFFSVKNSLEKKIISSKFFSPFKYCFDKGGFSYGISFSSL